MARTLLFAASTLMSTLDAVKSISLPVSQHDRNSFTQKEKTPGGNDSSPRHVLLLGFEMAKECTPADPNCVTDSWRHLRQFCGLRLKEILSLLKESITAWRDDNCPRLGASLAFYTLLSLAPLLVVIVSVAALAFGKDAAEGQLFWEIRDLVGRDGAKALQDTISNAYKPGAGVIAAALSIVTLALGATTVVVELRDALNTIWHAPVDQSTTGLRGIIALVRQRFYSFAMVLGVGFLLLVSLVLNAWIAAMGKFFGAFLPVPEAALHVVTFVVAFLAITFMFAAIYKIVPDVHLRWSDVIVGAAVTALIFTIGKHLIGIYLGKASFGSTYGAAGSLVIVLVWVYYSAQLFFLGAEFTKVYTATFGSHLAQKLEVAAPKPDSVILDAGGNVTSGNGDAAKHPQVINTA